jgi:hypothetical protein
MLINLQTSSAKNSRPKIITKTLMITKEEKPEEQISLSTTKWVELQDPTEEWDQPYS